MTTTSNTRRMIAGATLAVTLASFAALCPAADSDAPQAIVKYGDLNVSSATGAATLYARIRAAAEGVCRPFEGSGLAYKMQFDACFHKAMAHAVADVGQSSLFAVYHAKNGTPKQITLASGQTR